MLRAIILGADKSIEEGVKWNTASYRTTGWFATLNGPKQTKSPMVILHAGAKAKDMMLKDRIPDPEGLLKWLGNDRAQIVFKDVKDIATKKATLTALIKYWIQHLQP